MSGLPSNPVIPSRATTATATTVPLPLGFSAQLKALHENQLSLTHRITQLEHENAALKATQQSQLQSQLQPQHQRPHSSQPQPPPTLHSRISALEAHNRHLTQRRKEAVAQLLLLRTLHQESANAFLVRATDIEDDDLEGMLGVYGTSMTTVLNQHQRALGQLRAAWGGCGPVGYAYPRGYGQEGYCYAHAVPYPCWACGQ